MADVFNYFGQALTLFAQWLTKISSPVPWPLIIAFFFLPLVAIFRVWLWVMRGTCWPVQCKYFHTQQRRRDKACRTPVIGEWWYCPHHIRRKVMSDKHRCDPSIPRWQKRVDSALVERRDIRGVGFVRLMSNRETLLFYKGIARRPSQIVAGLRRIPARVKSAWGRLGSIRLADIFRPAGGKGPVAVADRMPRVVVATRVVLVAYAGGLIAVGVSVLTRQPVQAVPQYGATAAFVFAWDAFRFGIVKNPAEEPRWVRTAVTNSGKALTFLVILALVGNAISTLRAGVHQ